MKKIGNSHLPYYLSMAAVFVIGYLIISNFSLNFQLQMILFILVTIFYILIGIVHHLRSHKLSAKIVIEYVLIGAIGISLIFFLIFL